MKHLQDTLLIKNQGTELKVEKGIYENTHWDMTKHFLQNKISIMIACGRGIAWLRVGGKFIVQMLILLNLESCESGTF